MTDNEIKKALECCQCTTIKDCGKCPLYSFSNCTSELAKETLALFDRLQEEIERLKYLLDYEEKKYDLCAKRFFKEGVKEFAEELLETKFKHGNEYIIYAENIYTILKEMVGEDK